ncbi:hypothetical protein [Halomonas binhaiensis]|nr:hypothetical protein [Halomonas binhaiensis]
MIDDLGERCGASPRFAVPVPVTWPAGTVKDRRRCLVDGLES